MKEIDGCDPWSKAAKFKLEVEKLLNENQDLNWIIVRPAVVYGPGDKRGLSKLILN